LVNKFTEVFFLKIVVCVFQILLFFLALKCAPFFWKKFINILKSFIHGTYHIQYNYFYYILVTCINITIVILISLNIIDSFWRDPLVGLFVLLFASLGLIYNKRFNTNQKYKKREKLFLNINLILLSLFTVILLNTGYSIFDNYIALSLLTSFFGIGAWITILLNEDKKKRQSEE